MCLIVDRSVKISSAENSLIHLFLADPKGELYLAADEHLGNFLGGKCENTPLKTLKKIH